MATSRKVPVNRARPSGGSVSRSAGHPGVSGAEAASAFKSPYQPPAAALDFAGDITAADPHAWHAVLVGGSAWRLKLPTPAAMGLLAEAARSRGQAQVDAFNGFVLSHLHPDDVPALLMRMADPDDSFGGDEFRELYRLAVTVGTARPFAPWSVSAPQVSSPGGWYAPSSRFRGSRTHSVPLHPCTRCSMS